jgi:uncharacterized protein YjbI with pentapeptide repeats
VAVSVAAALAASSLASTKNSMTTIAIVKTRLNPTIHFRIVRLASTLARRFSNNGGAAVLIGAGFALFQFLQQQQTTESQSSKQQQAARELLISNQVSKGFEQLANDKIVMLRLGGIYALEGVMKDKKFPQYHRPVLEALCAFVREQTIGKTAKDKPATDVQVALTVIGRRKEGQGVVDLANVSIPEADRRVKEEGVVDLANVSIPEADLTEAYLNGAKLGGANLFSAELSRAFLPDANLSGAKLVGANLSIAQLMSANLSGAILIRANLSGANLSDADLRNADLSGAYLSGANLGGANLERAKLDDQAQLDEACGTPAKLPPAGRAGGAVGLALNKPCPPPADGK